MEEVQKITIGGKEYPVNITLANQRYSIEIYPKERLEKMTVLEEQDYTLDMILQILAEPKPFKTAKEIISVISPREYKTIDTNIGYWIYGTSKEEQEAVPEKQ